MHLHLYVAFHRVIQENTGAGVGGVNIAVGVGIAFGCVFAGQRSQRDARTFIAAMPHDATDETTDCFLLLTQDREVWLVRGQP